MSARHFAIALLLVFGASFALAQSQGQSQHRGGADTRRSGYQDMGPALQQMQDDDTANPGMLFVQQGSKLWGERVGAAGKACADCHGDAATSMKGVAARYPAIPHGADRPVDLEGRIDLCRTERQQAPPFPRDSQDSLALQAFVAAQSRGQPIAPPDDSRLVSWRTQGEEIYRRRQGQLNLSCAICHDENAGKKLAGVTIPQAHPTGYPVYRLEWQGLGSLRRRLRNCLFGIRAELYPVGAPEYVALELYLMDRARGMPMEAPAVRP